jgi:membrane protein YdbS with pleckstrin-like domain
MAHTLKLHDNEKIFFDITPPTKLALYLTLTNLVRYLGLLFVLYYVLLTPLQHYLFKSQATFGAANTVSTSLLVHIGWFLALLIPIIFVANLWSRLMVAQYQYIITNQRIINYSGFWSINCKIIPLGRIVDVDIRQSPLQSLFGISTVLIGEQNMVVNRLNTQRRIQNSNTLLGLTARQAGEIAHIISDTISGKAR